jgi:chemotaxis protein MotA
MDVGTIFGIVCSSALIWIAVRMGGNPGLFLDLPAFLIVFGGTFGAILVHYPIPTLFRVGGIIRKTLVGNVPAPQLIIDQFMDYAGRARREGILSLEPIIPAIADAYLRKGMQLAVDGLEPDTIQDILETEIAKTENRHETGGEVLAALATYAPALGLIGTVIGLAQMLNRMNDPATIGPAMAVALNTTLYGVVLANLVFLPLVGKLKYRSREELHIMEMQMEGILSLCRGENPRIILEKLSSFQSPRERRKG